jgi:O-antigen/teichoic acid export membrane protein
MRDTHPKMTVDLEAGRHLFENSRHFMISDIAILIYTQLDRIMLGKLVSAEATGLYSSASAIAYMWQFVPYALINSARPILLEKLQKDKEEFNRSYKVLLLGITVVCVMFSLGIMAFGKMIIMILYGPQYIEANTSLWVLVWASTFAMIGTARSIWIVGNGLNRFVTFYTVCGAITNIVLNFILIPLLGINGAALSTLASQFVVAMVAPTFIKETREFIHIYLGSFSSYKELIGITKETARKLLNRKKEYE